MSGINVNDCVVVNKCYVDTVLKLLSAAKLLPLTKGLLRQTTDQLGALGTCAVTVDEIGTVALTGGNASFLKFTQGVRQIAVYFPSLSHLERTFLLSTPKKVTLLAPGWGLQKGYYCASTTDTTLAGTGLFSENLTLDASNGSSVLLDQFGVCMTLSLTGSPLTFAQFHTSLTKPVCQFRHNPKLVTTLCFNNLEVDKSLFVGLSELDASPETTLLSPTSTLGQVGLQAKSGDANFFFIWNSPGGESARADSGVVMANNTFYTLEIFVSGGLTGASVLFRLLDRCGSVLASREVLANLPTPTTNLMFHAGTKNIGVGNAQVIKTYWGGLCLNP